MHKMPTAKSKYDCFAGMIYIQKRNKLIEWPKITWKHYNDKENIFLFVCV